ncbi:MAG TPA: hypothetical protein VGS22_00680 [Thermoanaerobaculia bacterium]|jgi:hypothetical protein|nr:hypothetical protein [Thermoanaerobaculia bacterium]
MLEAMNYPRRFFFIRLLGASLVLGALYDAAFAVVMVVAPELPRRILRLPLPGADFYLWLIAVLLLMLAALYLTAAHDLRRYTGIILVAIAGRLLGAAVLALAAQRDPQLAGLWPLAAADFAFGAVHAVSWVAIRK